MKHLFILLAIFILRGSATAQTPEVLIPFRKGNQWGLANAEGEVVKMTDYSEIRFSHYKGLASTGAGYCYVIKMGDHYGAMIGDEEIVRCKMDEVCIYSNIIAALEQHGTYSIFNHYGKQLLNGEITEISPVYSKDGNVPPVYIVSLVSGENGIIYLNENNEVEVIRGDRKAIEVKPLYISSVQEGWKICQSRVFESVSKDKYSNFKHKRTIKQWSCSILEYKKRKQTFKLSKHSSFGSKVLSMEIVPSDYKLNSNPQKAISSRDVKKESKPLFLGKSLVADSANSAGNKELVALTARLLAGIDTLDYSSEEYQKWGILSNYSFRKVLIKDKSILVRHDTLNTQKYGIYGPYKKVIVPLDFDSFYRLMFDGTQTFYVLAKDALYYLYSEDGELIDSNGFEYIDLRGTYFIGYRNGKSYLFKVCRDEKCKDSEVVTETNHLITDSFVIGGVICKEVEDKESREFLGYLSETGTPYFTE